jgi:hypothetical protein
MQRRRFRAEVDPEDRHPGAGTFEVQLDTHTVVRESDGSTLVVAETRGSSGQLLTLTVIEEAT